MFNRGDTPMVILDSRGKFLHSWGDKQMFPRAHGVTIGPDDSIWLTDVYDHTVKKVHCRRKSPADHRRQRQARQGDEWQTI